MNPAEKNIMSPEYRRCYACLNRYKDGLVPLDTEDRDKITYLEKLRTLIGQDLIESNPMEICSECITKLRTSYQFQVTVLNGQVVLKLQKQRGINVGLSQRVGDENKDRIIKQESGVDEQQNGIVFPQSSIDQASHLKQPSEIACEQDTDNVSADSSADEDNSSLNLGDSSSLNDRVEPEKIKDEVEKEEPLCCKICYKKFDTALELEEHEAGEHKLLAHSCPHCPQRYGSTLELKGHLALRHMDEASHTCEICGEKNFYMSEHLRHTRSHKFPPEKRPPVPFLCTICGKTFRYSNGRTRHMKIHMGLKTFKCTVCNKDFHQKYHLETHMRIHTGEKPYVCELCGQTFSAKTYLNVHMRRKHKPEKSVNAESAVQSEESEASKTHSARAFYSEEFEEFQRRLT